MDLIHLYYLVNTMKKEKKGTALSEQCQYPIAKRPNRYPQYITLNFLTCFRHFAKTLQG